MLIFEKNHLLHVGVKGMKWGVRRPKKEDSEVVLKKGKELHSVMAVKDITLRDGEPLYTSFTKKDVLRYRGLLSLQIEAIHDTTKLYDHSFKAATDLITPTKKKKIEEFIKMHKDDSNIVKSMAETKTKATFFLSTLKAFGFDRTSKNAEEYRRLLDSKDPKDKEKAFQEFAKFLPLSTGIRKQYFDRLSKEGFNSIYDDNDIFMGNSDKPLIIFNQSKSLTLNSGEALRITYKVFSDSITELESLEKK